MCSLEERSLTTCQLGTATFDSRAAFIAGQSEQASIPWQQLNLWLED